MSRPDNASESRLAHMGLGRSDWFKRWFPDPFVLAVLAVGIVFLASLSIGSSVTETAQWFGAGFWDLVAFTMQMTLIIITGYSVATSPPVFRVIRRMALVPKNGPAAAAYVGLFSMLTSLLSWSFSLIFSGLLAREVAHHVRGADCRAVAAAAYLGVGSVWALGLSSSAALIMATALVLIVVSMAIAYYSAPPPGRSRTLEDMGAPYRPTEPAPSKPEKPGEWLEFSPLLTLLIGSLGVLYFVMTVGEGGWGVMLELNHYVFAFLMAGILLHWRPRSFVRSVSAAVPSVAGVLVQYPIYAGIVRMMTESGLAEALARVFVNISTRDTFPVLVGIYSAFLGAFIPSAGGKWLIEAPYVLDAAQTLEVNLGWVVQTYNASEALANLVHPFWMLPLLGILGLKARDIIGYTTLQFVIHVPLVLFLVWIFNYTLAYVAPAIP